MRVLKSFAIIWALAFATSALAEAPDLVLGTWDLNIAKSKYESQLPPKSHTRTYVLVGKEIKATSKTVEADGKTVNGAWSFSVDYDGKERPMTGMPDGDTLAIKRIDAYTFEAVQKRAGKVSSTGTRVISKDGKTMTLKFSGTTAEGKTYTDVEIFDKR